MAPNQTNAALDLEAGRRPPSVDKDTVRLLERLLALEQQVQHVDQNWKKQLQDALQGQQQHGQELHTRLDDLEWKTANALDEDEQYPQDCYSLIALNGKCHWCKTTTKKGSFGFWLFGEAVFLFQLAFGCMILWGVVPKTGFSNFLDFMPNNVGMMVRGAQILAMMAFVFLPTSCTQDVVTAIQYFPGCRHTNNNSSNSNSHCDSTSVGAMRFACLQKLLQGTFSCLATWIFVMGSSDILDVLLNFAAMTFVSGLDEHAFELAKMGVFGTLLREETRKIAGDAIHPYKLADCMKKTRPNHVWYLTTIATTGLVFLALTWVLLDAKMKMEARLEL